jgi:succinate dehydrogenase / fumarate reductase cytochrome b subunit
MTNGTSQPNRLGIWGWLGGGRWGWERYLYTLQRLSGLGLLLYFVLHILVTSSRAFGEPAWRKAMGMVTGSPIFTIGEYLVFAAFAYHAANGLRLVVVELGWGVGQPIEPIYPYKTSVDGQKPWALLAMAAAAILLVWGAVDFFVIHN